jgi:arabinogalactan oligomer/maltooligosaccharide transport system substrate-binding protein
MIRKFLSLMVLAMIVAALSIGAVGQDDALVIWADGERAPLIAELGEQFTEEFGVPVEIQEFGFGDLREQLLVAGPAGEGPDIMIVAHDWIGQLVANGAISPIDLGDQAENFTPSSIDKFTYGGQLWGVPYGEENIALIRNVDLVPEAPKTWQEVRAIAEQIQADGTADYGFLVNTGDVYHNFPIISAFGGYIFGMNEDGTFNTADLGLGSEGGLAAAEWLAGMYADGLMVPNVGDDVVFEFFTNGDLGMFVTGPWHSNRLIETGINYSIDPLPGAEGGLEVGMPFAGGQGFVISAFSDKQLEAETFLLDFVATPEFMQAIFDQGKGARFPAYLGVDTSEFVNVAAFQAAGENSIPMPAIPEMATVWGAGAAALNSISTGGDPVEAMNTAVDQMQTAIEVMGSDQRIVVLPGAFQVALGCAADWDPACRNTELTLQDDGTYVGTFDIPAGTYEYKVAINLAWGENYGAEGVSNSPTNLVLELAEDSTVTFVYDDETHLVTTTVE